MDAMTFGGTSVLSSPASAIIDSGTSLLAGPKAQVDAMARQVGAQSVMGKEYVVNCSTRPAGGRCGADSESIRRRSAADPGPIWGGAEVDPRSSRV